MPLNAVSARMRNGQRSGSCCYPRIIPEQSRHSKQSAEGHFLCRLQLLRGRHPRSRPTYRFSIPRNRSGFDRQTPDSGSNARNSESPACVPSDAPQHLVAPLRVQLRIRSGPRRHATFPLAVTRCTGVGDSSSVLSPASYDSRSPHNHASLPASGFCRSCERQDAVHHWSRLLLSLPFMRSRGRSKISIIPGRLTPKTRRRLPDTRTFRSTASRSDLVRFCGTRSLPSHGPWASPKSLALSLMHPGSSPLMLSLTQRAD